MDGAAVELDDVADDREAQPEPAVRPRGHALGLTESVEHVGKELGGDALPRVGHADLRLALHARQPHHDATAGRRELHGVGEEIPDHLLQAVGIAHEGRRGRMEIGHELQRLGVDGRPQCRHRFADDRDEVDRPHVQAQHAGDDARDIEEIVDDLRLGSRVPLDRLQRIPDGGRVGRA